jgi:hypothetical protein
MVVGRYSEKTSLQTRGSMNYSNTGEITRIENQ